MSTFYDRKFQSDDHVRSFEEVRCEGVATRVPDHSLMHWEVAVDWEGEVKGKAREAVVEKRYRVAEGYLDDEVGRVRMLIGRLKLLGMTRWLLMKPMTSCW